MLTESQAWQKIGDAFEAKDQHPDLVVNEFADLAEFGLCASVNMLYNLDKVSRAQRDAMEDRINEELEPRHILLQPWPSDPDGPVARAALAYLFAAETLNTEVS